MFSKKIMFKNNYSSVDFHKGENCYKKCMARQKW